MIWEKKLRPHGYFSYVMKEIIDENVTEFQISFFWFGEFYVKKKLSHLKDRPYHWPWLWFTYHLHITYSEELLFASRELCK